MKKKCIGVLLIGLFSLGLTEVAFRAVYLIVKRRSFPVVQCNESLLGLAGPEDEGQKSRQPGEGLLRNDEGIPEVIHPYFGFVQDPDRAPKTSDQGFPLSPGDPLGPDSEEIFRLAVLGGSFAAGLATQARGVLEETWRPMGKSVQIVTLALGGYKQPQQMIVLSYYLSLGAHFDAVINLDGFNEVALAQAENMPKGVNPLYPRAWYYRVSNLLDARSVRLIGEIQVVRRQRQEWAEFMRRVPGRSCAMRCALWQFVDHHYETAIADARAAMSSRDAPGVRDFLTLGPKSNLTSDDALYREIAQHWSRCSLQMKSLCDLAGAAYFHFLQPNQYDPNSKPLSQEELRVAYQEDHPYRQGVLAGYPLLREQGLDLVQAGVNFQDVSGVFSDHPETLYVDSCCHPNQAGYEIVARRIAAHVADHLTQP